MREPYSYPNAWRYGYCDGLFDRPRDCPWRGMRYILRIRLYHKGYNAGEKAKLEAFKKRAA